MARAAARAGRLYLIDASAYVYRAFHALPSLTTSRGVPTNAVLGFARMIAKLVRSEGAETVAVVFDAPGETFRDALFDQYKAHRSPPPDELIAQFPLVRRLATALRLTVVEQPGVEADDVIGTLATQASARGVETIIVTADKDMMQLVDERVTLLDDMRGRRVGVPEVRERFGVDPPLVPDVLGLMGDASDNIPGVTGVGEKTAMALVRGLGEVEAILGRLDEVEGLGIRGAKKIRETLAREADTARLSKTLATIRRDLPLTLDLDAMRWPGPDPEALRALLGELEMVALQRDLLPAAATATPAQPTRSLASPDDVARACATLRAASALVVVPAFDGPRATSAKLVGLAIAIPGGDPWVCRDPEEPGMLAGLAPILSDLAITKVGADLKALRVALARRQLPLAGPTVDLSLASYCLDPSRADHGLAALAEEHLGAPRPANESPTDACARLAVAALALRPIVEERLRAHDAQPLFRDVEMPLAEVLAQMELAGIAVDTQVLATMSAEFASSLDRLEHEIHDLAGGPFTIHSPVQLRDVLFERLQLPTKGVRRGKTGLSTDVDVLTKLAELHPLPAKILEYRQLAKLKSTYVDALPALVDATTKRLHTSFNQTVAATGRLSSSDPNLQNIPIRTDEGRRIRTAFVAGPGKRLISADYSQIELRVLAHLSADPALCEAFAAGDDIHARTAATVFGDRPVAEGRRLAKVINYGILYGMGPVRAARELGVSYAEAERYIAEYFRRYQGVRRYLDQTLDDARSRGWVETVLGRRRYLPELGAKDPAVRQFAERAATNTPIQGSAADLIKLAMLALHRRLRSEGLATQMLLQVHDELVLEAPGDEVERASQIVRECMESVWDLRVPLQVDVRAGATWAEVH